MRNGLRKGIGSFTTGDKATKQKFVTIELSADGWELKRYA